MHLNRWVLLISLVIGIPGLVYTVRAFTQYTSSARAFSDVTSEYVPGSFKWLEPDYSSGSLHLMFRNESDTGVTVTSVELRVYFDGEFAGARYQRWQDVYIPAGESRTVEDSITISMSHLRDAGGSSEIEIRGDVALGFDGIERGQSIRIAATVGQVEYAGE